MASTSCAIWRASGELSLACPSVNWPLTPGRGSSTTVPSARRLPRRPRPDQRRWRRPDQTREGGLAERADPSGARRLHRRRRSACTAPRPSGCRRCLSSCPPQVRYERTCYSGRKVLNARPRRCLPTDLGLCGATTAAGSTKALVALRPPNSARADRYSAVLGANLRRSSGPFAGFLRRRTEDPTQPENSAFGPR